MQLSRTLWWRFALVAAVTVPAWMGVTSRPVVAEQVGTCEAFPGAGLCCQCAGFGVSCHFVGMNGNTECTPHLCEPTPCFALIW